MGKDMVRPGCAAGKNIQRDVSVFGIAVKRRMTFGENVEPGNARILARELVTLRSQDGEGLRLKRFFQNRHQVVFVHQQTRIDAGKIAHYMGPNVDLPRRRRCREFESFQFFLPSGAVDASQSKKGDAAR